MDSLNEPHSETITVNDLPRLRVATHATVYANQVQIGISPFDFQFNFGQLARIEDRMVVQEIATVVMSPQHAKAMIAPLLNMLMQYEQQYGLINATLDQEGEAAFAAIKELLVRVANAIHDQRAAAEGKAAAPAQAEQPVE